MRNPNRQSKPFRVLSIEPRFNESSLFAAPHIYMAPQSMKELGLKWGEPVAAVNFKFGDHQLTRTFVLVDQTLRSDELILGEDVAGALKLDKSSCDVVVLCPHFSGNEVRPPPLPMAEIQGERNKLETFDNIYRKKQKYELMAFVSEGLLKIQVRDLVVKRYRSNVKILQASGSELAGLRPDELMSCLNDPAGYEVYAEMGVMMIKWRGELREITLKQVPEALAIDTEMTMLSFQHLKKQLIGKETSFINKSSEKGEEDQQIQLTPNVRAKSAKISDYSTDLVLKTKKNTSYESESFLNKRAANHVAEPRLKELESRIIQMEEQIKSIKEMSERTVRKNQKMGIKLEELNRDTNEKLNAIVKEDWLAIQTVKKRMNNLQRELSDSNELTKNIMRQSLGEIDRKIKDFSLSCSKQSSSGLIIEKDQYKEEESSSATPVAIPCIPRIYGSSRFISEFEILGESHHVIKRVGSNQWTQLLMEDSLEANSRSVCTLKVLRSKFFFIMLGVVDKKMAERRSSWTKDHCLAYLGWSGEIYASGEKVMKDGARFSEGATIVMEIQPEKGKITWSIGGVHYIKTCRILRKEGIEWVPYLEMHSSGDMVEWQ